MTYTSLKTKCDEYSNLSDEDEWGYDKPWYQGPSGDALVNGVRLPDAAIQQLRQQIGLSIRKPRR